MRQVDREREDAFIGIIQDTVHHSGDEENERQWYRKHTLGRRAEEIWAVIREAVVAKVSPLSTNFEELIRGTSSHSGDAAQERAWFFGHVHAGQFSRIGRVLPIRFKAPNPISILQSDPTGCQPHERYVTPIPEWAENHIPFIPRLGHCEPNDETRAFLERLGRYESGEREPGEAPRRIDELKDPF